MRVTYRSRVLPFLQEAKRNNLPGSAAVGISPLSRLILVSTQNPIRQLAALLVQSVKLQLRLGVAIGALAASECLLLTSLLLFPVELLMTLAGVPLPYAAGAGPSRKLAEWGLYFLEWAPRAVDGRRLPPADQPQHAGTTPENG